MGWQETLTLQTAIPGINPDMIVLKIEETFVEEKHQAQLTGVNPVDMLYLLVFTWNLIDNNQMYHRFRIHRSETILRVYRNSWI